MMEQHIPANTEKVPVVCEEDFLVEREGVMVESEPFDSCSSQCNDGIAESGEITKTSFVNPVNPSLPSVGYEQVTGVTECTETTMSIQNTTI